MRRDSGYAATSSLVKGNIRREWHDLLHRYDDKLGRRAEWPITLRAEAPHPLTHQPARHLLADCVDDSRTVAVRDDSRVRHPDTESVAAFLDIAWVDARSLDGDPDLTWPGHRILHRADDEDVAGFTLRLVPRCSHELPPDHRGILTPRSRAANSPCRFRSPKGPRHAAASHCW
jgi:hypothetical protein